jgi:hypothetical protein
MAALGHTARWVGLVDPPAGAHEFWHYVESPTPYNAAFMLSSGAQCLIYHDLVIKFWFLHHKQATAARSSFDMAARGLPSLSSRYLPSLKSDVFGLDVWCRGITSTIHHEFGLRDALPPARPSGCTNNTTTLRDIHEYCLP